MLALGGGLKVQPVFVSFCTLPGGMCKKKKEEAKADVLKAAENRLFSP